MSFIPKLESACINRLASLRFRNGPICRKCDSRRHGRVKSRPRVLQCKDCGTQTSVTAGTLMHGCHIPIRYWFIAAALLARDGGYPATLLAKRLRVCYETAWQLLHRLREAMADPGRYVEGRLAISHTGIRCGRPYRDGGPREFPCHRACVGAITGDRGVRLTHLRHRCRLSNWAQKATEDPPPKPKRNNAAGQTLKRLWAQVMYTHCGVSGRYLRRYVAEAETRLNGGCTGSTIVAGVMRSERSTFEDLRPAFETWGFSRAWMPVTSGPLWAFREAEVPPPTYQLVETRG